MSAARPSFTIDLVALAEDDGFEAFVAWLDVISNPIPVQEMQRRYAWRRGWCLAQQYVSGMKEMPA